LILPFTGENGLVGEFPEAVSYLRELDTLMLEHGQLRGTIPNLPIFKTLRVLELSNNTFIGPIPSFMAQSASLEIIDLSFNKMTGTIAPSFFALPFLDRLELHNNALQGPLHRLIDDMPDSLEHLALYDNDLSGSIPSTVAKLSNLKYLSLDKMAITGTIPSEIRALTNLEDLALLNVLVTPQDFPVALYELSNLIFIDLRGCHLRGNLTNAGVAMWQNLWFFDVSDNELTGPFPTAFKDTKHLEVLNLSGNRWSGSVPLELCHIDFKVGCLLGNEVTCPCCKVCCDDDSGICAEDGWL
jgi:Leucine-rich repeat (LRR) protein